MQLRFKFRFNRGQLHLKWCDGWQTSDGSRYFDIENAARTECLFHLAKFGKCPTEYKHQIDVAVRRAVRNATATQVDKWFSFARLVNPPVQTYFY